MRLDPDFYHDRVCLNVLVNSIDNARACFDAAHHHVVLGLLSINYPSDKAAIDNVLSYEDAVGNAISIGLGSGSPKQTHMVTRLARLVKVQHYNQVFTGVGATREAAGNDRSYINGLVSPTGRAGYVNISTGPASSQTDSAVVAVDSAVALLKDMGASSLKFFPMQGLAHEEEFRHVARACAELNLALEPTGGIELDNIQRILHIALSAGVKHIIPHVYSSIIDCDSGDTRPEDVAHLFDIVQHEVA